MIINFPDMEEVKKEHFYGGVKTLMAKMFIDENNKILRGRLEPGASIGLHTHETSSEIIYILEGSGNVLYDGEYEKVIKGQCHFCPKGHSHSLINDSASDLLFFAVVPEQ